MNMIKKYFGKQVEAELMTFALLLTAPIVKAQECHLYWDYASDFQNGIATVMRDGKCGCINLDGQLIVPYEYDYVWAFQNDRARVVIHSDSVNHEIRKITLGTSSQKKHSFYSMYLPDESNGKYGFIDNTGKLIIPMEYDYASDFFAGYSVVFKDGKCGLIDINGDIVVPIENDDIILANLSNKDNNGLIGVVNNSKMGFFDINERKIVVPLIFDETNGVRFSEDRAVVNKGGKKVYVDLSGKQISSEEWDNAHSFNNGISVVSKDETYYIVDKNFNVVDTIGDVSLLIMAHDYSVILAKNTSNDWSIISAGNKVVNMHYSLIDYCGKPFLIASINKGKAGKNRNGLIDLNGNIVMPMKYDKLYSYADGFVLKRRNKWTYLECADNNLSPLFSIKCQEIDGFVDGLSRILKKGKFGYINKQGEIVIPCKYEYSRNFQEGKAVVMNNNRWGFIDIKGEGLVVNE